MQRLTNRIYSRHVTDMQRINRNFDGQTTDSQRITSGCFMFVKRFVRKLSGDTFYLRFLPDTCPIYDCLYLFTADLLMIRRLLSIPVLFAASCLCTCCIWITIRLSISIHSRPSDDHTAGCRHTSVLRRHLSLHVLYMYNTTIVYICSQPTC